MAKFQIKLLTSRISSLDNATFLETPMTEFYNQMDVYENRMQGSFQSQQNTYCYTFNEKVSFHTNGQKELQFSMLKNIWIGSELTLNPFVSVLKNGSQVLLIDQYDNEFFFTIKDISYVLGANNITYNYSCQDSFTYQHIRQNNGYSIENDSSTENFIGAKTIDWWVINKIQPECHISYEYIPLSSGLYMDNDKNIRKITSKEKNIYKVIKPIFDQKEYIDYYEQIPFSISGSNASSALISLAEELGLMLNYCECSIKENGRRTGKFVRYFWFEAKKNEKVSNLKYSPGTTIQSLNFSQNGNSLTTVLNVEGRSNEDEIVTLLPEVPYFFTNLFSFQEWNDTLYSSGFFSSICKEKVYISDNGIGDFNCELSTSQEQNIIFDTVIKIPRYYDKVSFDSDSASSYIVINKNNYGIKNLKWEFIINGIAYDSIPASLQGEECNCSIKIYWTSNNPQIEDYKFVIRFHRDATVEELEFAEIADKCPWLENKIIDLSYFYNNKILSQREYESLLDSLQNRLRKVNGKLLYYSKDYFNAIHSKTSTMAELVNTLDSVGAAFTSDVVNKYQKEGFVSDVQYFSKAYDTMILKYYNSNNNSSKIINYEETLTDYWNKYFNTRQRFLKNIYNFRNFFNQQKSFGDEKSALYTINLTLGEVERTDGEVCYWSFKENTSFKSIGSNFTLYNENLVPSTKIYRADKKTEVTVVTKDNAKNFFTNQINAQDIVPCSEKEKYSPDSTYFRLTFKAKIEDFEELPNVIEYDGVKYYQYKKDEVDVWYTSAAPSGLQQSTLDGINYIENGNKISLLPDFVKVGQNEIVNDYIYLQFYRNKNLNWFYHNTDTKTPIKDNWWSNDQISTNLKYFSPLLFNDIVTEDEYDKIKNGHNSKSVTYYKNYFPVKEVYFTGVQYANIEYEIDGKVFKYQPVNLNYETLSQYIDSLNNKNAKSIKSPFAPSQQVTFTIPIVKPENENQYFRRVPKAGAVALSRITLAMLLATNPTRNNENFYAQYLSYKGKTKWKTSGRNVADFFDENLKGITRGYQDREEIIYARTADAFDEYRAIRANLEEVNKCYISGVKNKQVQLNDGKPPYNYYDFYSKIAFTYSSARADGKCTFTDGYLRPLKGDSLISSKYKYRILSLVKDNEDKPLFSPNKVIDKLTNKSNHNQLSKVMFYFLYNNTNELDVANIETPKKLNEVLKGITWETDNFYGTYNGVDIMVFQEEDFKRSRVVLDSYWDGDLLQPAYRFSICDPTLYIHDYDNSSVVNILKENYEGLVCGFYKLATEDTAFIPVTEDTEIIWNEDGEYKTKFFEITPDNQYRRAYTILQMKEMNGLFYYINNDNQNLEVIGKQSTLSLPVYLHKEQYDKGELITSSTTSFMLDLELDDVYNNEVVKNIEIPTTNGTFSRHCTARKTSEIALNNLSNGEFWYQFRNRIDNPTLFEEAAVIESQLTQYWSQAYSASLYCEYFIPEYWQPRVNGEINYFSDGIFNINKDKITLSNKYIPEVSIYNNGKTSLLPKWELTHTDLNEVIYELDDNKNKVNNESYISASTVKDNLGLLQAFEELGEKISNYYITNYNGSNQQKTNYYYVTNATSGTKWKDMIQSHSSITSKYEKYSGLYIMTYNILKNNFNSRTIKNYNQAKNEQQQIWDELYKKFPGVLLEDSFKNDYASTSLELYNLASIAFKDKINIENNYNISLINAYKNLSIKDGTTSFSSYRGQELKIGESILIDADDYCDTRDDIHQALSQYLFITDLSYDLRKDGDVSLTVNPIKYQDKLIQRLVKLIK